MNTIVLNTLSGAVTEYTGFGFHSITPTHAGSATGLFVLGGDTDHDRPIVSDVRTATKLRATTLKKAISAIYFSMAGQGQCEATVFGSGGQWSYEFPVRADGQSRAVPGRGIRENYLGFGFRNLGGGAFTIDRIEVLTNESKNRRI